MVKKIITVSIGIAMTLVSVAPAFAGISISNTGQNSSVAARVSRAKNHVLDIVNSYSLVKDVIVSQTTGGNTADNNTGEGLTSAGNVSGNHTSAVEANSTNVDINGTADSCNCDQNITVDTTGQNSTVNANIDAAKNVTVNVSNTGTVNHTFVSTVNTGGNTANNNTGNGTAVGGDVSVWSTITTKLNSVWYKLSF